MKRPVKLLVFAKTLDGGIGTFLINFLKIKKEFANNEIIIKNVILEKPRYCEIKKNNFVFLKTRDYSLQKYSASIKNVLDFMGEILWFKNHVEEFKPDVVLSVDVNCNLISGIIKMMFVKNLKTVFTTHIDLKGTLLQKSTLFLRFFLKSVITLFYNRADSLITISKNLGKGLRKNFSLKKEVIPIYYSGFYKMINNNNKQSRNRNNIIVTVARLDEPKDHATLLKAFRLIKKEIPASKLWIVGDGVLRKSLEKLTEELELEKNVRFFGWTKNVFPYIKKSDVFVLSTKREGLSCAILEAISQGKPVVATNAPFGPSEILDKGKYGLLVPVGNETSLKKSILSLLTNHKKYSYYSQKALERSEFFSEDKMLKSYKKIIIDLYKDKLHEENNKN